MFAKWADSLRLLAFKFRIFRKEVAVFLLASLSGGGRKFLWSLFLKLHCAIANVPLSLHNDWHGELLYPMKAGPVVLPSYGPGVDLSLLLFFRDTTASIR